MSHNRKVIREWMYDHAHEYNNGPALASAAMEFFCVEQAWMWDAAQELFDLKRKQQTSERYG